MNSMTRTRYVTCRFCNGRVGTDEGDLTKLEKHMINAHDMLFAKEFSAILNILSQEEVESILSRLELRLTIFKDTGALEYNNNIFEKVVKPKQIFVENSLTLIGDNTDESESESEACNEEKETLSEENNIEKQQKAILDLLDSDEDDEDTVFQENSKNPVEKIRRRVFSEDMTSPRPSDLEDEMSRTSTLSDKENNAKKENTGETNLENAYFDDQRKKIENMLFSDDEDSNSENEDDPESVNEEQSAEPSVDNERNNAVMMMKDFPQL